MRTLMKSASRIPKIPIDRPVANAPSAVPPRDASMNRLTAWPRRFAAAADCTKVFRRGVGDTHRHSRDDQQYRQEIQQRVESDSDKNGTIEDRESCADPTTITLGIDAQQANTAQQPADPEGADRDAELLRAAMPYILDQHRTERNERSA